MADWLCLGEDPINITSWCINMLQSEKDHRASGVHEVHEDEAVPCILFLGSLDFHINVVICRHVSELMIECWMEQEANQ
jgi:hypothetical protein